MVVDNQFEVLQSTLAFDLWANLRWWEYLEEKPELSVEHGIFQHIFSGQEVWLQRVYGSPPSAMPRFPITAQKISELNEAWMNVLSTRSDNPIIHYYRFDGVAGHLHLDQIARQIIDHGTYHRGELRGLCRSRGVEDFPETGLGLYYMTR